jgi:hypothetical protein
MIRLTPNCRIHIEGIVHQGAQRFQINLLQGQVDGCDAAYHFNPRFDEGTIVQNSRRNGRWVSEERKLMPVSVGLAPGSSLNLYIQCNTDKYMVDTFTVCCLFA